MDKPRLPVPPLTDADKICRGVREVLDACQIKAPCRRVACQHRIYVALARKDRRNRGGLALLHGRRCPSSFTMRRTRCPFRSAPNFKDIFAGLKKTWLADRLSQPDAIGALAFSN